MDSPATKKARLRRTSEDPRPEGSPVDTVLVALYQQHRVGVACYDAQENDIRYYEAPEDDHFSVTRLALYETHPTLVVSSTSSKKHVGFLTALASDPESPDAVLPHDESLGGQPAEPDSDDQYPIPDEDRQTSGGTFPNTPICPSIQTDAQDNLEALYSRIHFVPAAGCTMDAARDKIALLRIADMPSHMVSASHRMAFLSSSLDYDQPLGVRAVGTLIAFLVRRKVASGINPDDDPFCLDSLESFSPRGCMHMAPQTFHSLQIFKNDPHPLLFGSGRAKEGLSLFGIVNRTKSHLGARLLRQWFHRPLASSAKILERQVAVAALASPEVADTAGVLSDALRQIKNVPGILSRIRTITASIHDWKNLWSSAVGIARILEVCTSSKLSALVPLFGRIAQLVDTTPIATLSQLLSTTLDFERSKEENRLCVKDGVSAEVDELRRMYETLDDFLTKIGVQQMESVAQSGICLHRLQVVYFPQIGYLISIEKSAIVSDPSAILQALQKIGFKLLFTSNETQYFKNNRMLELDEELGDVHGSIMDKESEAIREIEGAIEVSAESLLTASRFAAELDCLQSLAAAANEFGWVCPEISQDREIHIREGRHPLQELTVTSFVTNDTYAAGGGVQIVTGPNYSGKSVYVKQVALMVYMTHIGCFVPAEEARIGVFDRIMTRIRSFESVSLPQSTFFIDCSQIAYAVRQASPRSLLVVDEFGKGTSDADGLSLLSSLILGNLGSSAETSPTLLIATHFKELLTSPILPKNSPRVEYFSMEVLLNGPAELGSDKPSQANIIYLYRLSRGTIADESHALRCASLVGLPQDLLRRALQVRSAATEQMPLGINQSDHTLLSRVSQERQAMLALRDLDVASRADVKSFLQML